MTDFGSKKSKEEKAARFVNEWFWMIIMIIMIIIIVLVVTVFAPPMTFKVPVMTGGWGG